MIKLTHFLFLNQQAFYWMYINNHIVKLTYIFIEIIGRFGSVQNLKEE